MAKDFAQSGGGGRQARSDSRLPGWVWLLMGIAIGGVGAAGYYISRPAVDAHDTAESAGAGAKTGGKKKIAIPPKEPSRFAFYELLPSYEVVIPRESLKPQAKTVPGTADVTGNTPVPAGERFLIQVGSFKARAEAEQQKASLALLGIESRVEQVTIDNKQTWYRVRVGPEKDAGRVQTIMARLEENGIKALVMRVSD